MSGPRRKRPQPHVTVGQPIHYTEEEGRRLYEEAIRRDNGTAMIVQQALDSVADGAECGRNLLDVVAGLIAHLTPEQRRGLAERCPDLFAGDGPAAPNGVPRTEAG